MIETFCKDCGQRYPLGQDHECKKRPAKKSTASRKDAKPDDQRRRAAVREGSLATAGFESHPVQPVGVEPRPSILAKAEAAAAHLAPKRGRGRPRGPVPFDKKAHDRQKSKERRAAKAQQEGK